MADLLDWYGRGLTSLRGGLELLRNDLHDLIGIMGVRMQRVKSGS